MRAASVTLLFCAAVCMELLASRYGLMPPAVAACAYCLAMRTGGWRALLPALLAAAFTDALWGHVFPSRMAAALFCILAAACWRTYGDVHTAGGIVVSIAATAFLSWVGSMLGAPLAGVSFVGWRTLLTQLLWCIALIPLASMFIGLCLQRRLSWYSAMAAEEVEDDSAE